MNRNKQPVVRAYARVATREQLMGASDATENGKAYVYARVCGTELAPLAAMRLKHNKIGFWIAPRPWGLRWLVRKLNLRAGESRKMPDRNFWKPLHLER